MVSGSWQEELLRGFRANIAAIITAIYTEVEVPNQPEHAQKPPNSGFAVPARGPFSSLTPQPRHDPKPTCRITSLRLPDINLNISYLASALSLPYGKVTLNPPHNLQTGKPTSRPSGGICVMAERQPVRAQRLRVQGEPRGVTEWGGTAELTGSLTCFCKLGSFCERPHNHSPTAWGLDWGPDF